jgi:hypothetical protein
MPIFEKDSKPPMTPKLTDHYTEAHGRWCADLMKKGILHEIHHDCAQRFITGKVSRDRRGRPVIPAKQRVARKKEVVVV